jgi:phytoene dehydrogenase-like protein
LEVTVVLCVPAEDSVMSDIVVVGGGLAGLTAAKQLGDATVFEREDTVGGRVRSTREDGYTFDRGFQVLFTAYPAVRRELDLDALSLRYFSPGATIARPNRRSVLADPLGDPRSAFETLFNREVRTADKLRLFALQRELAGTDTEEIMRPDTPDRTIEEYLGDYGFSTAFVESFAAPFYGGITLDRSLSVDARVFQYTFKMLAEGKSAVPAEGMGAITAQLAEHARDAGATIETGATVEGVDADDDGVTVTVGGETVDADAAVVATDPKTARELTGVESIPTGAKSCVTQYYTLPTHAELDTGRKLLLNAADDRPNQIAPLSAVAEEYAPAGEQLLSATYLGTTDESDEDLAERTRRVLTSWYPERDFGALELRHTDRVEFAQFPQPPGFLSGLPDVDAPDGNVFLAGDFTRWCSIQGAMESGRDAAAAVRERLD